MGKEVEANEETYYVSGHNDLQYIIRKTAGTYLLWKFMYFESDEYPFKDVLSLIYDVHSEQDIKEVYVKPSDVDNTDEGKALQLEIGNVSITDSDSITSLYKVLNSLTCYGPENWDRINYGQDDGGMLNAVRNGRYLTFSMANGCKLDSLKYTAVSGTFYEYGGVAYNELRKEQKDVIEEILNIDCSISEQQETEQRVSESEVNTEIQDAPADESTYQEASDYSAELTDLQNRITQASATDMNSLEVAILFYSYLNDKTDDFLEANDFSRDEIKLGMENVADNFGLNSIAKMFLTDF